MSEAERYGQGGPDDGDDETLAAEYALGALPLAERRMVEARIEAEPAFAALVAGWSSRLSPLDAGYAPVTPPASLKAALDRRLFGSAAPQPMAGWWNSLAFWRPLAFAASLVAIVSGGMLVQDAMDPQAPAARLVVSLEAADSPVKVLALYDPRAGAVSLAPVSGDAGEGRDYELWLIEGDNAPASLGLLPDGGAGAIDIPADLSRRFAAGATLAISLEPQGGSPTGQPTGPVVAAGQLRDI